MVKKMNSLENEERNQNKRKNTLRQIEWLLEKKNIPSHEKKVNYEPYYGDVTELNTCRVIMDSVGKDTLKEIAEDAIDLLGTSVAIYEANGDYAFGMFSSGWCQLMDTASRELCQTDDNRKALDCGGWLCHDNCWNYSAKAAIESGQSTDIQCVGGINLYGEPIYAGGRIVGVINIGYGTPPKEASRLKELAKAFDIDFEKLNEQAISYDSRPDFLLTIAKRRLKTSAKLIGEIVEKAEAQKELIKNESLFRGLYNNMTSGSAIYEVINDGSKGSDFIIKNFNQKSLEIEGQTLEQIVGKSLLDLRPNIDDYGLIPVMKKVWETGKPDYLPVKIYQDERFLSYYENYIFKIPTGEIVTIYNDVTEQKNAEKALRESEEQFRYLSDGSMEAIFFTKDGFCLEANQIAVELFGYDYRSEFIGIFGTNIIAPESHGIVKSNMLADKFEPYEAIGMRKDGTRFPISIRSKAMPYKDAGIVRVTSITDISKIKQSERALRESEEDLMESQRIAHVGSWRLDLASNQVVWSEELYKMYGFDPMSPPPPYTEHQKLFTPESWNKLNLALNNTKDTGIPYELELETLTEDGSRRGWMWLHGEAVRDARGDTVGLRGAAQDITERKQIDEALKASEKKYQSLFQNAQVALFRNRLSDGKLLEINERYAKMAGYSTIEDCMAEFNAADAWVDPNERKELLRTLQENGFVSDYETKIIRKGGSHIWISFSATIFPEQGFLEGSIVEITERKRSEIERKKLQAQLAHAHKIESVGRLAGGVAHDFNNMLSVILGNTEILMEDIDPSNPLVTNLEEIFKAAERSANLTRQLLAFARKQTIDPKVLNLNHVLDDLLKMLKRLIGEDIDLTWQPSQNLWTVKIDPSQIDQILANLCVNARDAIKSVGKVTIEINNISFDEAYCKEHAGFNPGNYVMMAVSDNGSGMDQKTLDNLFEPFFTTKDIGQGTGLGLATVYGIVKQNDGFINVYSEPGEGTTFKIYLPVYSEMAVPKQNTFKKTSLTGNETILLVEDEKPILRMTKMMLERLGYTVLTASAPKEAISIVEASNINTIHLLLTDVVMPEMNGRDLSKKLLSMYPDLKCLFMSGYTANVIAHHGVLDTGVQFINKPFSTQDLSIKVREVLDQTKGVSL